MPRTIGIGMATRGRGSNWHRRGELRCPHNMTPAADCMCRVLRLDQVTLFAWSISDADIRRFFPQKSNALDDSKSAGVVSLGDRSGRNSGHFNAKNSRQLARNGRKRA